MAILYIGPNRSPEFETDYYLSPILSPAKNLAHFPPVYLICGERDPFVDDTVIFAGKLREAKRARRRAAENGQPATRPGHHGDGLRLSEGPDHILRETDDDWVQMRIIEGWGHGFMQMTALMREVDSVLVEMADWIDESFERETLLQRDAEDMKSAAITAINTNGVYVPAQDPLPSPLRSTHVKPARDYKKNPTNKTLGVADLGGMPGLEEEDDGMISFTPKNKRRTPPSSQFIPVPRRASRESLTRNNSAPMFDNEDSTSSGEALETPPTDVYSMLPKAPVPRGAGTFAFFGPRQTAPSGKVQPKSAATSLYSSSSIGSRRGSTTPTSGNGAQPLNNPLLTAAASAARAASPALAAAGLVPQHVQNLSQAELYRRRRQEMMVPGNTEGAGGGDPE